MNLYSKTRFKEKTNSIKCTLKKIILIYTENQSQHIPYNIIHVSNTNECLWWSIGAIMGSKENFAFIKLKFLFSA